MIDLRKLKDMLQGNHCDLYYFEDELDEIIELVKIGQALKSLPHGAGITHGFSDITRDWVTHWSMGTDDNTFHRNPLEALEKLKEDE